MGTVTLVNGEEVDSASEAWRFECECRYILALPSLSARREWLYGRAEEKYGRVGFYGGLLQKRGPDAVKAIEAKMMEIWKAKQSTRAE